ncbi:Leu/Phe/Val dehydrogenase [Paenibacillus humicola]|uniref:Leu/Phe/Val dehydrogenase n=1 Tax=Paenibacillus humicola TaxID=3110540 RepID=UPI00237AD03D|nr:Glu/Leu/Phe/Val dehydrogenase dimerization domain-containing protein [Paenibacillus humicola]
MDILDVMERLSFEQLVFCRDPAAGLKAVIAIHSTKRGPALGGCRMWRYADGEEAALDAIRLARSMTYKAAVFGLNYGGGKAVIVGDPATDKSEALFRALGRRIGQLQGTYMTGVDLGTTVQDMDLIRLETPYVTDTTGTMMAEGDFTAEMTACGVYLGMKAAAGAVLGSADLQGVTAAVQGLGKVGSFLCAYLHAAGARLIVSDIDAARAAKAVQAYGAAVVPPEDIVSASCDIFAPCALGGVLNERTVPLLNCKIVAGSANNQLAEERCGDLLSARGIVYVPDFVVNAGGLIVTACELDGLSAADMKRSVERVYDAVTEVLADAQRNGVSTWSAAEKLAERNL